MAGRSGEGKRERPLADPLRGGSNGSVGSDDAHFRKRRSMETGGDGESGKKQKISVSPSSRKSGPVSSLGIKKKAAVAPIALKLSAKPKPKEPDLKPVKSLAVSKVFGDDSSEDEEEEIPPEARMRMKNLGRMTSTSAGPNSFNKSKDGFTNHHGRAWRLKKEEEIAKAEHEKWVRENKELEGSPVP